MELKDAIEYVEVLLELPKWYAHSGNDEDFLRGIDKSAIETILNHIKKQEKMIQLLIDDLQEEGCLKMAREEIDKYYEKIIKLQDNEI